MQPGPPSRSSTAPVLLAVGTVLVGLWIVGGTALDEGTGWRRWLVTGLVAVWGLRLAWHIRGRAIDIARKPGVTHSQIAAAFRNAGYQLVESLDEGDHSHFAFAFGGSGPRVAAMPEKQELTKWGVVTVSAALLR